MADNTTTPPAAPPAATEPPATPPAGDAIESTVERVVSRVLGPLLDSGRAQVTDRPAAGARATGTGLSPEQITAQVRQAVADARTEQEHENFLATLRSDVDQLKATPEEAPVRIPWAARLMGWHRE